jgi:hypothetical protein
VERQEETQGKGLSASGDRGHKCLGKRTDTDIAAERSERESVQNVTCSPTLSQDSPGRTGIELLLPVTKSLGAVLVMAESA